MTLQLLACLARVQLLAACKPRATHEIQSRVLVSLHNLEHFFTLSHTLPLHESHLNTGLLIAKIQANLTRNKANKMVDKIQPYNLHKRLEEGNLDPKELTVTKEGQVKDFPNGIPECSVDALRFALISYTTQVHLFIQISITHLVVFVN